MRKLLRPTGSSQHHDSAAPNSTGGGSGGSDNTDHLHTLNTRGSRHMLHDRPSTSPVPLLYRPSAPQEAAFQVGVPIASLDKSPDGRAAVLAGRHVLKTARVENDSPTQGHVEIKEAFDLRALITAQSSPRANATASVAEQLSIRDVKWGTGRNDTHIFTACLRGKIFRYDLSHLGAGSSGRIAFVQTQEDSRQINTLDINPHNDAYLLSGSQDGMVRWFDTRAPLVPSRLGPTFRPMQVFKCNADVRAVQWSPKQGFYFACCTEQGVVMKWDIRKSASPVLRITAHESACSSLSWHPDGEHLMSGGVDKKCHVWDLSKTADKRQKPKWTLHTPAAVAAVAWRPGQWSATCQGLRAAQVAVSYDVSGPKRPGINAAHVWDLARPTIPYKTVERFECSPSALLWKDQEFLWTVGEDGLFCQNDVTFAPRVLDRTAVSTLTFSATGDILTFLDERPPPPRPRVLASVHKDLPSATAAAAAAAAVSSSYSSDPSTPTATPTLSISRSDSEDDVVRGFLLPRRKNVGRRRRASSVHHHSTTPSPSHPTPSSKSSSNTNNSNNTSNSNLTVSLEDSLRATGLFRPQQIMAIGHIPSAARKDTYGYLTKIYLETLKDKLPVYSLHGVVVPLPDRVAAILDTYARAAENVSQFRLAQVWRILAFAMDLLFRNRGQYHKERRLEGGGYHQVTAVTQDSNSKDTNVGSKIRGERLPSSDPSGSTLESVSSQGNGTSTAAKSESKSTSRTLPVRSLLAEEIESTSNMPTPLARPVSGLAYLGEHYPSGGGGSSGGGTYDYLHSGSSYDSHGLPSDIESFNLPPARYEEHLANQPRRRHLDSMPLSEVSEVSHNSSEASHATHISHVEGYDFYDTEAMASAIDVPGAAPAPTDYRTKMVRSNSHVSEPDSSQSPVRTPQFHRQDSTDSAAGRIFELSQASGHALDDVGLPTTDITNNTDLRGRDRYTRRDSTVDDLSSSLSRSRGRQPHKPSLEKQHQQPSLASSVGSSQRLLRLNKALLSMEWGASGSNPSLSTPGVTRDTYYRTNSQDTESSSNSVPTGTRVMPSTKLPHPTNSFTNKRPILRRSASSRQDTASIATSEFLTVHGDDEDDATTEELTDRDYLPWPHDPPFPFPTKGAKDSGFDRNAALNPYVIVERALSFEVRTSPLHASAMVLLLKPLVPDDVVDALQAKAILRQHHSRLMGMKLFLEAALLRNLCVQGWPSSDGCALAKWGANANYTSIFAPAEKNVSASYICVTCKKPREDKDNPAVAPTDKPPELWKCDRCKSIMAPCAVCGHREIAAGQGFSDITPLPGVDPVLSTWWYCVGCSHGGHLSCLEGWHAQELVASSPRLDLPDAGTGTEYSDGCCPLDGCGHACLPGQWRTETITQRSDETSRGAMEADTDALAERIRPDTSEAAPSRAVDMVRESLANARSELAGPRTILSSSPGSSPSAGLGMSGHEPRERERRKSVKFAGTDDR
ncbi:SEA (Seh1-associated) complex subunit [Sporothrix eucalyptigena]|uniref:SEA (Seh1-associated) complex subunit n=1 Tax=Sporothrix eucalyptigena TaxID=1812306 RepID=A0ABP0B5H1_9PEZI